MELPHFSLFLKPTAHPKMLPPGFRGTPVSELGTMCIFNNTRGEIGENHPLSPPPAKVLSTRKT